MEIITPKQILEFLKHLLGWYQGVIGKTLFNIDDGGNFSNAINGKKNLDVSTMRNALIHKKCIHAEDFNSSKTERDKTKKLLVDYLEKNNLLYSAIKKAKDGTYIELVDAMLLYYKPTTRNLDLTLKTPSDTLQQIKEQSVKDALDILEKSPEIKENWTLDNWEEKYKAIYDSMNRGHDCEYLFFIHYSYGKLLLIRYEEERKNSNLELAINPFRNAVRYAKCLTHKAKAYIEYSYTELLLFINGGEGSVKSHLCRSITGISKAEECLAIKEGFSKTNKATFEETKRRLQVVKNEIEIQIEKFN